MATSTNVIIDDVAANVQHPLPVKLDEPNPLPVTLRRGPVEFLLVDIPTTLGNSALPDRANFLKEINGRGVEGWRAVGVLAVGTFTLLLQRELA